MDIREAYFRHFERKYFCDNQNRLYGGSGIRQRFRGGEFSRGENEGVAAYW